jgi:signal transduction histidine kinase
VKRVLAPWRGSLRLRLLLATLSALLLALVLAGVLLSGLFREHVMRQFGQALTVQLDQVTTRLAFKPDGRPRIDPQALSDPRWLRPYSGLYWQIDHADGATQHDVLRSRSLWDTVLTPPGDALADGEVHAHEVPGPAGTTLLLVERTVAAGGGAAGVGATGAAGARGAWRLMVAADVAATREAVSNFNGVLAASLGVLALLLAAAALAFGAVGLAPLRALQRALVAVQEGRTPRLEGAVPAEVQPLVDDFNRVLDRHAEVVARARTQAGNLAHAIKTPLAALSQAAEAARGSATEAAALPALVLEQVALARRQVDGHLARARVAATLGLPGSRTAVQPAVAGLVRVMERVHAGRGLTLRTERIAPTLHFAGEQQDLQEMAGNLIDNACKWARHGVRVTARAHGAPGAARLELVVEDDGPGIATERRQAVMARGARLDESVPGSGLGLAIVQELAALYGGQLRLDAAPAGGLRAVLDLPGG